MESVLVTAFEAYDEWQVNASWLALVELTKELPQSPRIVTRRYPVDFSQMRTLLEQDLAENHDFALHIGQAPGLGRIHLESVAINIGGHSHQPPDNYQALVEDGPAAYVSKLPLAKWASALREQGIPAQVSHHAGTFLCNATMYMSHYIAEQQQLKTQAAFLHIPLDISQALMNGRDWASMPSSLAGNAIRAVIQQMSSDSIE
jgi:pyroglutamyl-peptidase